MSNFERELVKSFNDYFSENGLDAIAYRMKQHQFSQQMLDVLVDSSDRRMYLGIECKSISAAKGADCFIFLAALFSQQARRASGNENAGFHTEIWENRVSRCGTENGVWQIKGSIFRHLARCLASLH